MNFQFLTAIASFKPHNLHIAVFSLRLAVMLVLISNVFTTQCWEARILNIDIRKTAQSPTDHNSTLEYNNF